ncbi:glucose dehydrogenase [FAD, quinone]-like [Mizuhopecten yessoensis]|uniref:Glucose dehydrogenase [acceptor] n=1 Tax=Mizuhopecten yessoensis TaxID=6573 RepID=A0A210Q335_MIZYE|nr:glucose dehydrogenase [FAD, quinone]-like [Mizuhopecten yessoensis]OWF43150.1 Glucose dehydrogenase [acceptor] [Mizuhopecten yessoensis]
MDKFLLTSCMTAFVALLYFYYIGQPTRGTEFPVRLNETYDYIIVGAGAAGSVLASRLSEDPNKDILLLEAGGSEEDNPSIRVPGEAGQLAESEQDWMYFTEPQKNACLAMKEQRSYWTRGKVLGGSTALNYLQFVRGNRHDYNSWAEEGCDGWSYKDVLPYFIKSEDIQIDEFKTSEYHGTDGPLPITRPNITPMQQLYLNAGKNVGYNITDCNGEDQIGFCWTQSNIKSGERWSNYRAFVEPHMGRNNLHISPNTFTTKIIIKDKKAIGVECIRNGRKVRVFARKEVILSAGAINSPHLLMLSGVGPKDHLQKYGIELHADLPVGKSLQEHIFMPLTFTINTTDSVTLEDMASWWTRLQYNLFGTGYLSASACEGMAFIYSDFNKKKDAGKTSDFQLQFQTMHMFTPTMKSIMKFNFKDEVADKVFTAREDKESITIVPMLLHPKSRGTIQLKSTDPFDYPEIDPHNLEHPDDVKMAVKMIRFVERLVDTDSMRSIGMDVNSMSPLYQLCIQHEFRSDEFWECYVRYYTVNTAHATSTCRMGATNDRTAVVDPQLRVKGISSLRVVDASVMRRLPAGNTHAPVTMIAEKAADIIRQS